MMRDWIGLHRIVIMDLLGVVSSWRKTRSKIFERRTGQHRCTQTQIEFEIETPPGNLSNMASSWCKISPIIPIFVCFLLVSSLVCPVHSSELTEDREANQTFRPEEELRKLKIIRSRLRKINKPAVKTIQAFYFCLYDYCFIRTRVSLPLFLLCLLTIFGTYHMLGLFFCRALTVIL